MKRVPTKGTSASRRTPRQNRSRELVETVIATGLEILEQHGPTALTVRAVCDRAGVSVGSVYQYFETKEALIAAVYQGLLTRAWQANLDELAKSLKKLSARGVIELCVREACERELQLYDLHPEFYRQYVHTLLIGGHEGAGEVVAEQLKAILVANKEAFLVHDADAAAFVLVWGLASILRTTLLERPDSLRDPRFQRELQDMVVRYLLGDAAVSA